MQYHQHTAYTYTRVPLFCQQNYQIIRQIPQQRSPQPIPSRLRTTNSVQQFQKAKVVQPTSPKSTFDPALMVALIKENQQLKAKIQERETQLTQLTDELESYEKQ